MGGMENLTSRFLKTWHRGNSEGLEKLLERHLPWIQAFVHKRLSPFLRRKNDTGDIVQDAMVQFLRFGPRFHITDEKQFRALMCRIIRNVMHDHYDWYSARRRAVARERPLPSDTILNLDPGEGTVATPSSIVHRNEQEAWVRLGLELLDPGDRRIIVMHDWEELSFAEIGSRIGVSKDTARRNYTRSLGLLTSKVGDLRRGRLQTILKEDTD